MPINPDFSALEAVITAKVEAVATNIDNKDLLIQMKALEAAVANLSLTRVIAEGTYQSGQLGVIVANATTTINGVVSTAQTTLQGIVDNGTTDLSDAAAMALSDFNTASGTVLTTIDGLLTELGSVNTADIIALVEQSLLDIAGAASDANTAITEMKDAALLVVGGAGSTAVGDIITAKGGALDDISSANTSALDGINTAKINAIAAVGASSDISAQLRLVRDDRWLGLDIYSPTVYPV
jgi:hypothetical protein